MNGRLKFAAAGIAAVVALLTGLVFARALLVESHQPDVDPVDVEIADFQGAVDRLSAAIRHRTISPSDPDADLTAFDDFRRELEEFFPTFHDVADREVVGDATLHYSIPGSDPDAPHVVFLAHQDVVPVEAQTEQDWEQPPFSGSVADGFVWGRGALDNKNNLMSLLEAAEQWLAEGERPRHTLHFVLGHDEEIGGLDGAAQVAERLERDGTDVAAVYDEGLVITRGIVPGIDTPLALIGIAERGYVTVEITATAPGGHSSMPPSESAVVRLARALETLDANPREAALEGPATRMFQWVASEMDFGYRLIFRNLWLFEPLVLDQLVDTASTNASVRTTAAQTMLRAGERENVLPQRAVATVNFRIHPRDSIDEVVEDLRDLVGSDSISVRKVGDLRAEPAPVASIDTPAFAAVETALGEVFEDVPMAPSMVVATTDSRHFTSLTNDVYRFSPVILGADDLDRIHGTNERIGVDAYLDSIRYWLRLLRQW